MMNNLSIKMSLLFAGLALITIGILAIWVNQTVDASFTSYCQHMGTGNCEMVGNAVATKLGQAEQEFLHSFQRSLLIAAGVSIAIAIAMGFIISKLITRPLQQLAFSARKIAAGDLAQRVRHNSNDEVGEVSDAFNSMAEQLENKEKSRKQLLADVAHELRNPLSIVQGNLEAWLDGVIKPSPEQIASVYDETILLNRLITDLRELSLAEAGQLKLHIEKADMNEIINTEVTGFQARCQGKRISLSAVVADILPEVNIDRDRIRQVLHNLLENALRYTPADGSIDVKAGLEGTGLLKISVSDSGSGIASNDLPFIFEHFYKADKSRQRSYGGAGIGLALVKKYVELHGGSIWVDSVQGKGSAFYFTLPVIV
ncbi:MAG: HAMP domain-containing protein [Dehalococcoidia bacterium]|nr:HAMP domain-containing protein [Dehalococcoidia bacterium]